MYISKFSINNYKSYLKSGDLELNKGINIITGQNNAGKTALLQSLSLNFENLPHKSTTTLPNSFSKITAPSFANIELNISREELRTYIINDFSFLDIPNFHGVNPSTLEHQKFYDNYLKDENVIKCKLQEGRVVSANFKSLNTIKDNTISRFIINKSNGDLVFSQRLTGNNFLFQIVELIIQRIYCFQAERLNISQGPVGIVSILKTNASNLPEVLNILQSDRARFERFNSYVRKIFPQIFQISIRPSPHNTVQIVVWNENPTLERIDLVVPLSECGTGLGQVLAILYVILTSDIPKIIIIDEPNSFLHPGASRKLVEILKEHPQHQFIISTHSPSTIAASNPKTINIIRIKEAQSYIESVSLKEVNTQQLYLAEIGSKLSDVFGADNILWVEGKTEEICFPKIIEQMKNVSLMGTTILSVINTGDLQRKKDSKLIFSIYEKLSTGKGLLPAAIGFIFDSEKLTQREKEDLAKRSNNKVTFTERRMFENYLLNLNAVCALLNSIPEIKDLDITIEKITDWHLKNKWNKEFINQKYVTQGKHEEDWIINVDGAKLLIGLFGSLTEHRIAFDKVTHSVLLAEWIIENSFEEMKDIQDILSNLLSE